ncbi:hypothetical protein Q764_11730 [Flavobacterium suncheonense GH29-5 = DSM 17707]|uniref:Uncharacterized protein n=1 Tax=Flavobacterium suncheonense GH29-5 = DSM 17707 TaxID=1121899 RepID=A0A0A2M6M7_9FLAO|nr:hypothetical protein Q764_11730 [Flavobacterium suncheonense GH29-5 = DSM 17707]
MLAPIAAASFLVAEALEVTKKIQRIAGIRIAKKPKPFAPNPKKYVILKIREIPEKHPVICPAKAR